MDDGASVATGFGGEEMSDDVSDSDLRAWLLRGVEPARQATLEERLFVDDDFLARVRAAEFDLFDDYARGRLSADDRAAFQARWLVRPDDRRSARVAGALRRLRDERRASSLPVRARSRRMRLSMAAAAVLALAVIAGGLREWLWTPRAADERADARAAPTLALLAARMRGGGDIAYALPAGAEAVRVQAQLESPDAARTYALILGDEDAPTFSARGLPLRRAGAYGYVEAVVPSAALRSDRFCVTVRAEGASPPEPQHWCVRLSR